MYQFEINNNTKEVVELFKGVVKVYAYHYKNKKYFLEKAEQKLEMCIQACETQGIDYTSAVEQGKCSVIFGGLPSIYRLHNQELDLEKKYEQEKMVCQRLDDVYKIKKRLNSLDSTHRDVVQKVIFEDTPLYDYALTRGLKKHHVNKKVSCKCVLIKHKKL